MSSKTQRYTISSSIGIHHVHFIGFFTTSDIKSSLNRILFTIYYTTIRQYMDAACKIQIRL